jgi:cation diffusion facilitator CzcD-associated flavoprotein CzcO
MESGRIDESMANAYGIIGGGPSGIGLGKCLTQEGLPFEILESENDFGGNWAIDSRAGRVYESTHLISSRLNTEFSDFPMPSSYPVYPSHRLFLNYLRDMAAHFGLYAHTRFGVTAKRAVPDAGSWLVSGSDGVTRRYRGLFIANGMQREKELPEVLHQFRGEVLHSIDYRNARVFAGKHVLVMGGGNSGCDIAVDAVHTASSVLHSTRWAYHYMPKFVDGRPTQEWLMDLPSRFSDPQDLWRHVHEVFRLAGYDPTSYGLPKPDYEIDEAHPVMNSLVLYHIGHGDIDPRPDVISFRGKTARFSDGSEAEIDLVLAATGYRISFPFLDSSLMQWKGARPDLFLHMFHRSFDNLFFSGFVNAAAGFGNAANASGRLFASYIKAFEAQSESFTRFRALAATLDPDLGNDRYLRSRRHEFEVDLWKFVRTLNWFRSKLEPVAHPVEQAVG